MNDPDGLTLYVSPSLYEYYSQNGIPSPYTYLVKNEHLPLLETETSEDDLLVGGVTATNEPEPMTVDTLIENIKQLQKKFPDLLECHHTELICLQRYLPSDHGIRYMCLHCKKTLIITDLDLVTKDIPEIINMIGGSFGQIWADKAREENQP